MHVTRNKAAILAVLSGVMIVGGLPITVLAKNGMSGKPARDENLRTRLAPSTKEDSPDIADIKLASLNLPALALPRISIAQLPEEPGAIEALAAADALRESGNLTGATQAYVELLETYPDTPQATGAGFRLEYMANRYSDTGLDTIEAGLPVTAGLSSNSARQFVARFLYDRASRLMDTDAVRAQDYLARAMDVSWDMLQVDLDDPFKSELVEKYLLAAESAGQGAAAHRDLSDYAGSLPPCFTSWLIKTVVDGVEPPADYVPSFEGKVAIRKHFFRAGKASRDDAAAAACFRKARDVSYRLLLDQPADQPALYLAAMYLKAAALLGERDSAVAELETLLADEPLSIMRWIVRNELAMDSVQPGRSEEETRAGFSHFETAALEANSEIVTSAINEPAIDEEVRGILVCMLGHAFLGTNRTEDAKTYYEWVLDYYPKEAHAGDSAGYSLVELSARDGNRDPLEVASDFEAFVTQNPSGEYSTAALIRAAGIYESAADLEAARSIYERVRREYPSTSVARNAENSLERLRTE